MLYLRKTLLYSFIAVYLLICPLLILYSFGRILKPGGEGDYAGLIFLSTSPPGATVYVEGRRFSEKTPAALAGMLADSYDITLTLNDYKPWHYKVQTFAGLASAYDRILLAPKQWQNHELLAESFQNLISIPLSRFFILTKGSRLSDYYSFDSKYEELTPFVSSGSEFASLEVKSLFTVSSSTQVVIWAGNFSQEKYFLVEQDKGYVNFKDITHLLSSRPEKILWGWEQPDYLFSFQNNKLDKINTLKKTLGANYLDHLRGYGLFNGKIYVLKDINTLFRIDYDLSGQEVLINDPILGNFLFGREGFFEVRPLDEDIIIFLGEDGRLLSNHLPHRIVEKGVRGLEFHSRSKRVLFWMKNQAGIIDYRPLYSVDPTRVKTTPTEGFFFYSTGEDISQAFWAYQGAYIVLKDRDKVFLFELKGEGEAKPDEIVRVKGSSSVHYLESTGKLYYLDPSTRNLRYVEIISKDQEQPLSFQEYLTGRR